MTTATVVRSKRLADRRREVRAGEIRRRRRRLAAALLAIALVAGGWTLSRSRVFGLSRVEVVGAKTIPAEKIVEASGVRVGQNALALDLAEIVRRVKSLPAIADARVEREGSVAVRIVVVERAAVAEVRSGARRWFADPTGAAVTTPPTGGTLPVILLPGDRALRELGTTHEEIVGRVLAVWRALPAAMRARVNAFRPSADGGVEFTADGARVLFGTAARAGEKLRALAAVERRLAAEGRTLRSIDVRTPRHPAVIVA